MPDTTTLIITRCEEKSGEVLVYGRETSDPDTAERLLFTKKGRLRAFSQTQVAVEFYDGATEYYDARAPPARGRFPLIPAYSPVHG